MIKVTIEFTREDGEEDVTVLEGHAFFLGISGPDGHGGMWRGECESCEVQAVAATLRTLQQAPKEVVIAGTQLALREGPDVPIFDSDQPGGNVH